MCGARTSAWERENSEMARAEIIRIRVRGNTRGARKEGVATTGANRSGRQFQRERTATPDH